MGYAGEYVPTSLTLPITTNPGKNIPAFYEAGISTTASLVKVAFTVGMTSIQIENTGGASLDYSFNGTDKHGEVASGATVLLRDVFADGVWIKNGSGSTTATVSAWQEK